MLPGFLFRHSNFVIRHSFEASNFFRWLPLEHVDQYRNDVYPKLDAPSRSALEHRLSLQSMTGKQLWEELIKCGIRIEEADNSSRVDGENATRIVAALVAHPQLAIPLAMEVLGDFTDRYWLRTWCIELLGKLRHTPAVDGMIDRMLRDSGDFMHQSASAALGRMRDPLAEAGLLELLAKETNTEVITSICLALVENFTTEGLEQIRQVVIDDRYDSSYSDTMEDLVMLCDAVGYSPPELPEWQSN